MTETHSFPELNLTGKVAVVTGGSRGIGAATASALANNGAAVAVVGRNRTAIDTAVVAITVAGGRAIGVVADCTIEADLLALRDSVVAFSRHLANEVAGDGIRVNCLAPSTVENDKLRAATTPETRAALGASFPLGRIGQPDDVASAALFLASPATAWITGVTLDIAGGKIIV